MGQIAITGSAGFIGFRLAQALSVKNVDMLLIDHPPHGPRKKNPFRSLGHSCMDDSVFLDEFTKGNLDIQSVFHLGATIATETKTLGQLKINNIEISKNLWRECAYREIPFFYASTAATYGDGSLGFDDDTHPSLLNPLNLYAQSKNDFDLWALTQGESDAPCPPRWAGFKFFNVYGPGERHKGTLASMVWQCYRQIRESGEVKLFASHDSAIPDGGQERDFVFVDDCIDLMLWFWKQPRPSGIYNGGTGKGRTFLELAHAVFAAMGLAAKITFIPLPEGLRGKYQNRTCAQVEKLKRIGYFRSPTKLEDGIRLTIQGYQAEGSN